MHISLPPLFLSFYHVFVSLSLAQRVGGYNVCESGTLGLATSLMRDASDMIPEFVHSCRARVHHLTEKVIPEALFDSSHRVSFQIEHSDATYENIPQFEKLKNYNNFINIRIKPFHKIEKPYLAPFRYLSRLLNKSGIKYRDGYSFSRSTLAQINFPEVTICRISIGTEDLKFLSERIKIIAQFVNRLNEIYNSISTSTKYSRDLFKSLEPDMKLANHKIKEAYETGLKSINELMVSEKGEANTNKDQPQR